MNAKDTNTFRFVLAEGDRFFSSRWRIWTNDRCDQLMIAPSKSAYLGKVTIHFDSQERFCHFPINQNHKDKMSAQGLIPPRHKDEVQWFRTPTPPEGHQLCATFHLATKENVIAVTKVIDFDLAAFLQRHQA
jgi:hypothetical protein